MRDRLVRELREGELATIAGRVLPEGVLRDPSGSVSLAGAKAGALRAGDLAVVYGALDGTGRFAVEEVRWRRRPLRAPFSDPEYSRLAGSRLRAAAALLARVEDALRACLRGRGFLEVRTGARVREPGQEPTLEPVRTSDGRYLVTSPELRLKRLLAADWERVFEFATAFRTGPGEHSPLHEPEFTLLEWYRAFAGLDELLADAERLLAAAARAAETDRVRRGGVECLLTEPAEPLTVAEAFRRHAGVDLEPFLDGEEEAFRRAAARAGMRVAAAEDVETLFFRVLLERVERRLGHPRPTFLLAWPARFAALARLDPSDPRVALRAELYVAGVELGNGFDELGDPEEQAARMRAERARKRAEGRDPGPWPERFLSALERGMPPAAGMALGVDRLVLLLAGAGRLADVRLFPEDDGA